uniref:C2H2-type domain-containing protein n=1 Tax=Strongyloides papillosus TaxID=174720 RepID=A0A0N5BBA8_STREA
MIKNEVNDSLIFTPTEASLLHEKWNQFRNERHSSSSSDSGLGLPISSPIAIKSPTHITTSNILFNNCYGASPFSPPGLSPLTLSSAPDSAFIPTPGSVGNQETRFNFDIIGSQSFSGKFYNYYIPIFVASSSTTNFLDLSSSSAPVTGNGISMIKSIQSPSNTPTIPHIYSHNTLLHQSPNHITPSIFLNTTNDQNNFSLERLQTLIEMEQKQAVKELQNNFDSTILNAQRLLLNFTLLHQQQQQSKMNRINFNSNNGGTTTMSFDNNNIISHQNHNNLYDITSILPTINNNNNNVNNRRREDNQNNGFILTTKENDKLSQDEQVNSSTTSFPKEEYVLSDSHGKKQYICEYCNKDFRRPDILSR